MVVMKKILQSVALALAVLLAVQPALATMTCTQGICKAGQHSADCCPPTSGGSMRSMSGDPAMDSDSPSWQTPAQPALVESGCASAPCCIVSARTTTQAAIPAKSRVNATAASMPVGGVLSVTAPVREALISRDAVAPAPARYVLFQVLRI
jgi:hypothetical protein